MYQNGTVRLACAISAFYDFYFALSREWLDQNEKKIALGD